MAAGHLMQFDVTAVWNHWVADGGREEGNPTGRYVDDPWPCVFDPGGSSEDTALQDQVTTRPRAIGAPGNARPSPKDRLTFPEPMGVFEVDGDPAVFVSPFPSGRQKIGPVVQLKRVSG